MTFGSAAPNWRRTRRSASSRSASATASVDPLAENVLDATNAFALYIDDASALAGVPQDALQMLSESAQADGKTGYKISLQYPSYSAIVDYAHDRTLRQQVYRAYSTRASEFGDPDWNNGPLMVELLKAGASTRSCSAIRASPKCRWWRKWQKARRTCSIFCVILRAARSLHASATSASCANSLRSTSALPTCDRGTCRTPARNCASSATRTGPELKQYFTEARVLAGLFKDRNTVCRTIREEAAPVWHPDVRFYRIDNLRGELIGQFYLDLYARDHKQGGAWQDDARSRRAQRTGLATPVSFLTCNFSRPSGGKPATFKHDEVLTLFHEFGHGLHHMLTRVDEPSVSGIQGVEWDAIELPSQFMENFAWEWEAADADRAC